MAIQNIITEFRIRTDRLEKTEDPEKRMEIILFMYYFLQKALEELQLSSREGRA